MSMTGNVFSIPDPQKFVSIGDGYGANPDSLDFRCNYWGDGVDTTADILPRIERLAESPGLLIESVAGSEFASCGGLAAPAILWPEIDPEGHPLEDDPEYDDVDFSEAHIGFPAMKLKLPMENEDQIALTYIWSSSDDVYFYYDGGIADDFMGGYYDTDAISYPAQEDRNLSSSLYAVSNSELGFSLRVDVYFVLDGEIQMLSWDGFLEF